MTSLTLGLTKLALNTSRDLRDVNERLLLSLTQEIAMQIEELPTILHNHSLTPTQFEEIAKTPRFKALLQEQMITWGSSLSVGDRIKAKMQSMVEQALPELHAELIKPGLSTAKVKLVEALMKGGSIGVEGRDAGAQAERVNITINMGAEKQVTIDQPLTIDHDAEEM